MPKFISMSTLAIFLLVAAASWINATPAQAAPPGSEIQPADVEQKLEPFRLRAGNLATKLLAALERTERLFNRAGVLITKFEERGLDMTSARAAQAEAAAAIEQAKQAIEKFKNEVPTVTAKSLQGPVRKTAGEALRAIKEARAKVVEVIRLIRASYSRPGIPTPSNLPVAPTPTP